MQYLTNKFKSARLEKELKATTNENFFTCDTRISSDPEAVFDFLPMYIGNISAKTPELKFTGRCFDFSLRYENRTESSFDLVVNASNK